MKQVAGILVSDAKRNLLQRRGEAEIGEEFGDVADFRSESLGTRIVGLV